MEKMILRPDAKGRINLGELAAGVSSYRVNISENGNLTLTPYTEIPLSEKWIFDNEGPVLRNTQNPPLLQSVVFKLETFGLYFHSFLEHLRWIILSKSQVIGGFHDLNRAESVRHLFLVF
jgi:hypothetical protein